MCVEERTKFVTSWEEEVTLLHSFDELGFNMSKRKGLSADEKRKVILDIYHCQKEPFNLKEIEKLASKRGVVLQTVRSTIYII